MDRSGKNLVSKELLEDLTRAYSQGFVSAEKVKELKARPLGISSLPDKIVQEAMRMILNAIYEPEFARYNVNFGFRPKYGCHDAIIHITNYAKQMDYAIEGDIKGSFDNVNQETLLAVLSKKIADEKFLKLIKGGLRCGVMFLNFRQDSTVGTTQGSIVSPLFYNIYFHEFDRYVKEEFTEKVAQINRDEKRSDKPVNKLYNSISKKKTKIQITKLFAEYKESSGPRTKENQELQEIVMKLRNARARYKELDNLQKKVPTFAKSRQTIRFNYTRYADDWVFFTNADEARVLEWKEEFTVWLSEKLGLTLSPEKRKSQTLGKGTLSNSLDIR